MFLWGYKFRLGRVKIDADLAGFHRLFTGVPDGGVRLAREERSSYERPSQKSGSSPVVRASFSSGH